MLNDKYYGFFDKYNYKNKLIMDISDQVTRMLKENPIRERTNGIVVIGSPE